MVPGLSRALSLVHPSNPGNVSGWDELESVGRDVGVQVDRIDLSGHPITANVGALTVELTPDLLDAIHAKVVAVHAADLDFEMLVALAADRQRTIDRGIVGGWGNLQNPADGLDSPALAVSADK